MKRLAFALCVFAACGGPSNVTVTNDVTIHIVGPSDDLPFDPRGARLVSATSQLSHIAGHPIAFEIDAAVTSDMRADFEHQLINAIEQLARALTDFQSTLPESAPRSFKALQRVVVRYVATVDYTKATFESVGGTLHIDSSAHPQTLVPLQTVLQALRDEDDAYHVALFGNRAPDGIAPAERVAYFEYLTRHPNPPFMVRLDELARGTDLRAKTRAWLLEHPPSDGTWLTRELPSCSPAELMKLSHKLFDGQEHAGVDRFAFGISVIDTWLRSGKQSSDLTDDTICPTGPAAANGKHDRNRGCPSAGNGWLAFVSSDPARLHRLALALDERNDADLATAIFYSIRSPHSPYDDVKGSASDPFIDLLHQLDVHRKSWAAGVDVLAFDRRVGLRDESSYVWKNAPDRRGTAVFILSKADVNYTGTNNEGTVWRGFPRSYGSPIDAAILASMLDHGRPAFVEVPQIWPALGPSFSRADVLIPRLDTLIPDASVPAAAPLLKALSEIVTRMCIDRNTADLAKLHAWIQRRPEKTAFAILQRDTAPGGCATSQRPSRE